MHKKVLILNVSNRLADQLKNKHKSAETEYGTVYLFPSMNLVSEGNMPNDERTITPLNERCVFAKPFSSVMRISDSPNADPDPGFCLTADRDSGSESMIRTFIKYRIQTIKKMAYFPIFLLLCSRYGTVSTTEVITKFNITSRKALMKRVHIFMNKYSEICCCCFFHCRIRIWNPLL